MAFFVIRDHERTLKGDSLEYGGTQDDNGTLIEGKQEIGSNNQIKTRNIAERRMKMGL